MELVGNTIHHRLIPHVCPECGIPPIGGRTAMGMYVVRCRNKIHTNESIEGTEGHAIEKWNEWCESIEKKRASFNEKDDFWFLRLRADVLKCCGNPDNLEIVKNPNGTSLATCKKCGRRHHVMHSEPGIFGFN